MHQARSLERSLLKQQVALYHDRVRERVRQGNQLVGLWRRHGIFVRADDLLDDDEWSTQLRRLPGSRSLHTGLEQVRAAYRLMAAQENSLRKALVGLAQNEEPVRRFFELPGVAWIRAVTFYAYIDTPHRFRNKAALWRYAGIGLERRHSGAGPTRTRLSRQGNRRLKNVLLGAAMSAVTPAKNPFADKYRSWIEEGGLAVPNARRNVARSLASTLWSLWKTGQRYDPQQVMVPA